MTLIYRFNYLIILSIWACVRAGMCVGVCANMYKNVDPCAVCCSARGSEQQIGDARPLAPGDRLLVGGRLQVLHAVAHRLRLPGRSGIAIRGVVVVLVVMRLSGLRPRDAQLEVGLDGDLLRRVAA